MDTPACIRELLAYLEQHGGRQRRKDNGASACSTSQACAADTPVSGTLNTALQPIQREKLRAIFLNFCKHGSENAQCQSCMELLPFMLFAREAGMLTAQTGHAQLMAVFMQHAAEAAAVRSGAECTPCSPMLTLQAWLDTLYDVAQQEPAAQGTGVAPQLEAALKLAGKLLEMRHLYAHNQQLNEPWLAAVLSPAVVKSLSSRSMQSMLRGLFAHYAINSSTQRAKERASSSIAASQTAQQCADEMLLHPSGCAQLGKDLRLVPDLMTNMELLQCAHMAKKDTERGQDAKQPAPLRYPEFVEMVARCALAVHKWQPSSQNTPSSTFADAYSSHAKQAWLQDWNMGSSSGQAPYSPSWVGSPGGREGDGNKAASSSKRPTFHTIVIQGSVLDKEVPMTREHQERFEKMVAAKAAQDEELKIQAVLEVVERRNELRNSYAAQTMRRQQLEHLAAQDLASTQVQRALNHRAAIFGVPPTFHAQDATDPLTQTLGALDWTSLQSATV